MFLAPRLYLCFGCWQLSKPASFISRRTSQCPILRPVSVVIAAMLLAPAEQWLELCSSRTILRSRTAQHRVQQDGIASI